MDKKTSRMRRALRTRVKIKRLGAVRLCVHRTPRHIYAQLISPNGSETLLTVSSLDKEVKAAGKVGGNVNSATVVGKTLAQRAIAAGIKNVAFDRSGFRYHGRVKALADAAREEGLLF